MEFIRNSRLLVLVLAIPLLALALLPGLVRRPSGQLKVTVLDVGQGDSIFVETPSGRTILIDGGGHSDSLPQAGAVDVGERVVVPFLRHEGVNRLDIVLLTHPHGDHVGGLPAVLSAIPVGAVLDGTCLPYPSPAYQEFLSLVKAHHVPYRHAVRGMHIDFGDGVVGDILNPPAQGLPYGAGSDDATINNYSAVLRLAYGKTRILLDGDAEADAESNMLVAYPPAFIKADVLKVGHHGSRNASSDSWLSAVQPRYGIISCGIRNSFGHPHEEALQRLAAHGVQVYRTDLDGAVMVVSDGRHVEVHSLLVAAK